MRERPQWKERARLLALLALGAATLASATVGGCNAILGNEPGRLAGDASPGASCLASQKECVGKCFEQKDPTAGCSGACNPCGTLPNAAPGCSLQNDRYVCGLGTCNPQYDNCDQNEANGCETHTTTRASCGGCNIDCGGEFCEPQDGGYGCSATCDAPNITCASDAGADAGAECVDPSSDNSNCGSCGNDCTVTNGTGSCSGGACQIACAVGFIRCGNQCVLPDTGHCGAGCAPCSGNQVCDTTSDPNGVCTTSTCTPDDMHCGPGCSYDCTQSGAAIGEHCVSGSCQCTNNSASSCGCPPTACTALSGPGNWTCSGGSAPTCVCNGTVCSSGECCPSGSVCDATGHCSTSACNPPTSCPLPDGGCTNDLTRSPNCGVCGSDCTVGGLMCCDTAAVRLDPLPGTWSCQTSGTICNP